jgi:alginate O-acetyltransferase complex protein AlgJ
MRAQTTILPATSGNAWPQDHRRPTLRDLIRKSASVVFILALVVPLIGTFLKWDPVPSHENRYLAKLPAIPKNVHDLSHFSDLLLDYYRDHFGLRNTLIRSLAMQDALDISQTTDVIVGKDGWLFLRPGNRDMLADLNLDPFTPDELDAWQHLLERRNQWCIDHGIRLIVLVPPDKQSIYREYMPDAYTRLGPKTRLDQLIDRIHETHSTVDLLDLRPILLEAKKLHPDPRLYFKTDTHWTDFGAWYCYPAILNEINRLLGLHMLPQSTGDFVGSYSVRPGDLALILDQTDEYQEHWPHLSRRQPYPLTFIIGNPRVPVQTHGDPRGPRLFVIHDSFGNYFGPFLGPHFSASQWEWTRVLNAQDVLQFKPDIIIVESIERWLYDPLPIDNF